MKQKGNNRLSRHFNTLLPALGAGVLLCLNAPQATTDTESQTKIQVAETQVLEGQLLESDSVLPFSVTPLHPSNPAANHQPGFYEMVVRESALEHPNRQELSRARVPITKMENATNAKTAPSSATEKGAPGLIGNLALIDDEMLVAPMGVAADPDTDGDGLPDAWELTWVTNLTVLGGTNAAIFDADGGGSSDAAEFFADTNPLLYLDDPDSCLVNDGWQDVLWTNHVNTMTATNNQLTKISGGFDWNSEANSAQIMSGDGAVRFNASTGGLFNSSIYLGLADENVDADFDLIDYAILQFFTIEFRIVENGVMKEVLGPFDPDAELEIERIDDTIFYKYNGDLKYISQIKSSGDLFVDTSLYALEATIDEAEIRGGSVVVGNPATILAIERGDNEDTPHLSWFGNPETRYWLQWTDDLETWTELPDPIPGTGTNIIMEVQQTVLGSSDTTVFRVRENCPLVPFID